MQTLIALVLVAAAACAVDRPPGSTAAPVTFEARVGSQGAAPPLSPLREHLDDYLLPRYLGYEESPREQIPSSIADNDWLNKEINRIKQMEEEDIPVNPYDADLAMWIAQEQYMQREYEGWLMMQEQMRYAQQHSRPDVQDERVAAMKQDPPSQPIRKPQSQSVRVPGELTMSPSDDYRKTFALTPFDKGYYDPEKEPQFQAMPYMIHHEGARAMVLEPPRQIRQNPNLSKQKHLLEPDLGKLKLGPSHEESIATDKPRHIHVVEGTAVDAADSIYGVAIMAAVGTAITMAVVGFAFGWYTLSKKAKAAADVDYPAYGVTGPNIDTSGDRKLAQSAHMYHYQHQKQQIIAMERNGMEQRTGSVSEPESEEENEEGDYTVYECPGFATTGDIEVKNPLFSEDPTPATPGKELGSPRSN